MSRLTFPWVLRIASVAVLLAMLIRYVVVGSVMVPPLVTVILLIALSFSHARWPRLSVSVSLVPGLLIPVLVLIGYQRGNVELALVLFDWILFGWIIWCAVRELRRRASKAEIA